MKSKGIEQLKNLDNIRFDLGNWTIGAKNLNDTATARILTIAAEALDDRRYDLIRALRVAACQETIAAMEADKATGMTAAALNARYSMSIDQAKRGLAHSVGVEVYVDRSTLSTLEKKDANTHC